MKDTPDSKTQTTDSAHQRLHEIIGDIEVAMMTIECADGQMRSRPMMSQTMDENETIWFVTSKSAEQTQQITSGAAVNLAYASPKNNRYVSVSGLVDIVQDDEKLRELWSPIMKAWYPQGIEDPNIVLLKVRALEGSYWDAPGGKMIQFLKIVKAAITGDGHVTRGSEHDTVILSHEVTPLSS